MILYSWKLEINSGLFLYIGNYDCSCPAGYERKDGGCHDIDECLVSNPCGQHGDCSNLPGSHHCSCHPGYLSSTVRPRKLWKGKTTLKVKCCFVQLT